MAFLSADPRSGEIEILDGRQRRCRHGGQDACARRRQHISKLRSERGGPGVQSAGGRPDAGLFVEAAHAFEEEAFGATAHGALGRFEVRVEDELA